MQLATKKMIARTEGHVGWIIYNNPDTHNAISMEMQEAIPVILDTYQADDAVRVVVMRGAGDRAFVSGADISEFESKRSSPEARKLFDEAGARTAAAFARLEKPLIAMISGYCIGGGLATAMQADIRVASDDAQFGIPAARLGLAYGFGGVRALVALVGPAYAAEILLTAQRFSAGEALEMGLVNRVVPKDTLEQTVVGIANSIAANAPLTNRASKFAIRQALRDPDKRDLETVARYVEECFRSQDYVEGRTAFVEKRAPRFRGA
ncbi:MAG: enoyl-CoA hydratase/isomerase family protein [Chloroflexi bacterium]|nr:enoyl-CoA hydratase/isomerase family protein [Chloroflexota bacterium]